MQKSEQNYVVDAPIKKINGGGRNMVYFIKIYSKPQIRAVGRFLTANSSTKVHDEIVSDYGKSV